MWLLFPDNSAPGIDLKQASQVDPLCLRNRWVLFCRLVMQLLRVGCLCLHAFRQSGTRFHGFGNWLCTDRSNSICLSYIPWSCGTYWLFACMPSKTIASSCKAGVPSPSPLAFLVLHASRCCLKPFCFIIAACLLSKACLLEYQICHSMLFANPVTSRSDCRGELRFASIVGF